MPGHFVIDERHKALGAPKARRIPRLRPGFIHAPTMPPTTLEALFAAPRKRPKGAQNRTPSGDAARVSPTRGAAFTGEANITTADAGRLTRAGLRYNCANCAVGSHGSPHARGAADEVSRGEIPHVGRLTRARGRGVVFRHPTAMCRGRLTRAGPLTEANRPCWMICWSPHARGAPGVGSSDTLLVGGRLTRARACLRAIQLGNFPTRARGGVIRDPVVLDIGIGEHGPEISTTDKGTHSVRTPSARATSAGYCASGAEYRRMRLDKVHDLGAEVCQMTHLAGCARRGASEGPHGRKVSLVMGCPFRGGRRRGENSPRAERRPIEATAQFASSTTWPETTQGGAVFAPPWIRSPYRTAAARNNSRNTARRSIEASPALSTPCAAPHNLSASARRDSGPARQRHRDTADTSRPFASSQSLEASRDFHRGESRPGSMNSVGVAPPRLAGVVSRRLATARRLSLVPTRLSGPLRLERDRAHLVGRAAALGR